MESPFHMNLLVSSSPSLPCLFPIPFPTLSPYISINANPICLFLLSLQATTLYCLVTEYGSGGELKTHIRSQENSRLTEKEARPFMRQLISAIQYLHDRGVVHRFVTPKPLLGPQMGWGEGQGWHPSCNFDVSDPFEQSCPFMIWTMGLGFYVLFYKHCRSWICMSFFFPGFLINYSWVYISRFNGYDEELPCGSSEVFALTLGWTELLTSNSPLNLPL